MSKAAKDGNNFRREWDKEAFEKRAKERLESELLLEEVRDHADHRAFMIGLYGPCVWLPWPLRVGAARAGLASLSKSVLCDLQECEHKKTEAQPIVRLLEGMASALRFLLDHSLDNMKALGFTSASWCSTVCALVFGKLEDGGGFDFSQTLVDDVVAGIKEFLTGSLVPFWPTVPPYFLRPLVHLCISGACSSLFSSHSLMCN